jgi:hypothetical protein
MTDLQCIVKDKKGKQCSTIIKVTEPVAEKVDFICKNHTDKVQRDAAGNIKTPRPDVHFQETQFDPDMERSAKPIGTSHIPDPKSRANGTPPLSAYIVPPTDTEIEFE